MKMKPVVLAAGLVLGVSALTFGAYVQSFETDTAGWFGATRVQTGTRGVPSYVGASHAEDTDGAFTRWGGYSKTFQSAATRPQSPSTLMSHRRT
jgi:hypothetical protein